MSLLPGTWVLCPQKRRSGQIINVCAGVVLEAGPELRAAVEEKDGKGCVIVLRIDRAAVGYQPEDLRVLDDLNKGVCANGPPEMPAFAHNVILAMGHILEEHTREIQNIKSELERMISYIKS